MKFFGPTIYAQVMGKIQVKLREIEQDEEKRRQQLDEIYLWLTCREKGIKEKKGTLPGYLIKQIMCYFKSLKEYSFSEVLFFQDFIHKVPYRI